MKEHEQLIDRLLGLNQAPTVVQTAASVIGGLLFGTGFLGGLKATDRMKTYAQATRDTQAKVNQILPMSEARNIEAQAGLTADLAGYSAKTEAGIKQGLINRGITDKGIGEQAAGQAKAGLSGAYAQARATLARAKLNAGSAVSGALSTYQQELARKQYESMLQRYYGRLGIWGALSGGAVSLMDLGKDKQPTIDTIENSPGMPGTDERGGK